MTLIKSDEYISESKINRSGIEISREIIEWKNETDIHGKLVFCVVLKGGIKIAADIMKNFDIMGYPYDFTFVSAKSYYDGTESQEDKLEIEFIDDMLTFGSDRWFILIDDILDTGNTLFELKRRLNNHTNNVKTCVLIDKTVNRKKEIEADFSGFLVEEDVFLVGYGMGYGELYRSDPFISLMQEEK